MQPEYAWDEDKRISNLKKHTLDFQDVVHFVWENALISEDQSESYGELRYRALGLLHQHLVMLVFTLRGESVRVVSLRKATRQEKRHYGN